MVVGFTDLSMAAFLDIRHGFALEFFAMATTPSDHVAANVRRLRHERGLSLGQLSQRLAELGHPLSIAVLSKMELRGRGIDVDDLVALSDALDVNPQHLLIDPALAAEESGAWLLDEWEQAMEQRRRVLERANAQVEAVTNSIREGLANPEARKAFNAAVLQRYYPDESQWPPGLLESLTALLLGVKDTYGGIGAPTDEVLNVPAPATESDDVVIPPDIEIDLPRQPDRPRSS